MNYEEKFDGNNVNKFKKHLQTLQFALLLFFSAIYLLINKSVCR